MEIEVVNMYVPTGRNYPMTILGTQHAVAPSITEAINRKIQAVQKA
jgi:hypothetical protein